MYTDANTGVLCQSHITSLSKYRFVSKVGLDRKAINCRKFKISVLIQSTYKGPDIRESPFLVDTHTKKINLNWWNKDFDASSSNCLPPPKYASSFDTSDVVY